MKPKPARPRAQHRGSRVTHSFGCRVICARAMSLVSSALGAFEATEYSRQLLESLDAAVDTVGGWGEGGVSLSLMGDVFHSITTAKKLVPPCVSQLRSWVHLVRGDT